MVSHRQVQAQRSCLCHMIRSGVTSNGLAVVRPNAAQQPDTGTVGMQRHVREAAGTRHWSAMVTRDDHTLGLTAVLAHVA